MTRRFTRSSLWLAVLGALLFGCDEGTVERVTLSPGSAEVPDGPGRNDGGTRPPLGDGGPDGCGDGVRQGDEACDDGNSRSGDGCTALCELEAEAVCGDGKDEGDEECDDGNLIVGDGCDDRCRSERCGNERVEAGEECDPPSAGVCDAACLRVLPSCGDGEQQADQGEQCDDGNDAIGDGCRGCRVECGNGRIDGDIGEECEPLLSLEMTCDAETCQRLPLCGDGTIDSASGEECDPSDGLTCVNCKRPTPPGPDAGVDGGIDAGTCEPLPVPTVAIINGTFDADAAGWVPRTRVTLAHATQAAPQGGALRMEFEALPGADGGYEVSGAYQCVFVEPGAQYELKIKYRIAAGVDASVMPSLSLREHAAADCTGASAPLAAPALGNARDVWTAGERTITVGATARALFVQLAIVKPRNLAGSVLWDDVVLQTPEDGARCGNCVVNAAQGESCDDGNRAAGDGCNASCRKEDCGDGVQSSMEACDDGNQLFGGATDLCTPTCREKDGCDTCIQTSCAPHIDPCLSLGGTASQGPGQGIARAALCDELRACVHATGCSGDTAISAREGFGSGKFLEHCYCGTGGQACFEAAANGSCRAQVEAALETTNPVTVLARVGGADARYPIFAALDELLACERDACGASCVSEPSCGDGEKQDRTAAFAASYVFRRGAMTSPCDDALTGTGSGCSFEECDDGNTENGDGCDADCFKEECGNNIQQADEGCDDGNTLSGDGCDEDCVAEFVCGDDTVDERFEECDPPGGSLVCTEAQYEADPDPCACDLSCQRTVCGNGILQAGEDCDPPGPACSERCEILEDRCTSCVRRIDIDDPESNGCAGNAWLEGEASFPGFELGCVNDEACYAAWSCYRSTLCSLTSPLGPHVCYCGEVSADACAAPAYEAAGPCKDEIAAAFEAQFQYPAPNNGAVIQAFDSALGNVPPGGYAAFYVPYDLAQNCLGPENRSDLFRARLLGNGLTQDETAECVDACFPGDP